MIGRLSFTNLLNCSWLIVALPFLIKTPISHANRINAIKSSLQIIVDDADYLVAADRVVSNKVRTRTCCGARTSVRELPVESQSCRITNVIERGSLPNAN